MLLLKLPARLSVEVTLSKTIPFSAPAPPHTSRAMIPPPPESEN